VSGRATTSATASPAAQQPMVASQSTQAATVLARWFGVTVVPGGSAPASSEDPSPPPRDRYGPAERGGRRDPRTARRLTAAPR
jgi:hypothetical protein